MKYYSDENVVNHLQGNSVYTNLYNNNSLHLDDIALEYFGKKISYGQMFEKMEQTKDALVAFGVKKYDKVILFTSEQILARINETEAKLMIVLDQLYEKVEGFLQKACIEKVIIVPVYRMMPVIKGMMAKQKMKIRFNNYSDQKNVVL